MILGRRAVRGRESFQLFQIGWSQMASMSQALNEEKKPLVQTSAGRAFQAEENSQYKGPDAKTSLVCSCRSEEARMAGAE